MKILITGASGYIGSCLYFYLKNKFYVSGIDKNQNRLVPIKKCNLLNYNKLNNFLKKEKPNLIVHLAAQSLVDETINKEKYYLNNVVATKNLVNSMKKNGLNNLIFSSTAALYKQKNKAIRENDKTLPKSTYAKTKYECEKIIKKSKINSIILRFFNVCSSLKIKNKIIGEFHNPETHLIPTIVYKNLLNQKIYIYGNNYNTKDGTPIRDFIHVTDLAEIHYLAGKYLLKKNKSQILNCGYGKGYSVLEVVKNINLYLTKKIPITFGKRRHKDIMTSISNTKRFNKYIKWKPKYNNLKFILKSSYEWEKKQNYKE